MDNCVFCDIINRTIKSSILLEDDDLIVIKDILPKAPVHVLVILKKHIDSVNHLQPGDEMLVGKIIYTAKEIAKKLGVAQSGYKLVFNVGKDGGQTVPHVHLHLLGGKKMPE